MIFSLTGRRRRVKAKAGEGVLDRELLSETLAPGGIFISCFIMSLEVDEVYFSAGRMKAVRSHRPNLTD